MKNKKKVDFPFESQPFGMEYIYNFSQNGSLFLLDK